MSAPYECKQRTVFEEGKSGNVLWHVGMGKYWFFLDPKTKGIGSIVDVGHRVASRDSPIRLSNSGRFCLDRCVRFWWPGRAWWNWRSERFEKWGRLRRRLRRCRPQRMWAAVRATRAGCPRVGH